MKKYLIFAALALAIMAVVGCSTPDEVNPFVIGQTVYPADNFRLTDPTDDFMKVAEEGAEVINLTKDLIRVRFSDNTEKVYDWSWFVANNDLVLTDDWVLGNPFSVGQTVCAVPDSVREDFPDSGVVADVVGELLLLDNYDSPINSGHFQECQ